MNGNEFVEKILGHTNYDVGPLIKLTDGIETDWLEFKAATRPKDGKFEKNTNKWDYRWNVSKALFAMANSIGGAVIVGVGETKNQPDSVEPVSLEQSGFTGDKDRFMTSFGSQILHPDSWITCREGTWRCTDPHGLFRPIWGVFKDQPVIIILVKPRKNEDKWLQLEHKDNKGTQDIVLRRHQGDVGQTEKIPTTNLDAWWKNREVDLPELNERFNLFLSEWKITGKHSETVITEVVRSYLDTFQYQYMSEDLDTDFIPLYAKKHNDMGVSHTATQSRDVLELLEQNPRIVLLGDPGSGKSTCLRRKAHTEAEGWRLDQPWTLLVSLYEYTESGLRSLLLKQIPGLYWIDIEARIAKGEITLLLDALNECPAVYYENCHQEINSLLRDYPSARVAISSRLSHTPSFEIPAFNIRPMNHDQQLQFLGVYLDNTNKSTEILERLHRQSGAEFIASSPMLLKMVADIGSDGSDFPAGLAGLYHRYLEVWHQRESEKNLQNGSPRLWSYNLVREALALLSFRMRAEGKVSCNVNFAREILVHVMGDQVAQFLNRIAQGLLLKVDDKDEFLHFSHETIQEYLAAEYLAKHPAALTKDLLQDLSGKRVNNWAMPLVFAFELINNPSREFLQNAWIVEPMLVAAALRDSYRLAALPIYKHEDLWLRGVLRAMRGERATSEAHELAYVSHFPPKYPLPNILVATLRGTPFWYSAQTHQEGLTRLKRLQQLVFDRSSIWIELVPHICAGHPEWKKELSPPQQVLIGETVGENINKVIKSATVVELCTLLRVRKISQSQFISNWENALLQSDNTQIITDLIALLRTNAKLKTHFIRINQFSDEQKNYFRQIGKNWKLSFRLLNILVREGIISVKEIRDDEGRLEEIISRMSPMNAFRFMKNGVIKRQDIPDRRFKELIEKMPWKFVRKLQKLGLMTSQNVKESKGEKIYTVLDLISEKSRTQINAELLFQEWEATILSVFPSSNFGFVEHPNFSDNAIFWPDEIDNPDNKTLVKGDILLVKMKTQFNRKKKEWGFAVRSGSILEKFSGRRNRN